ncbi:hypothetical protein EVA_09773 [gut metagenome]|uniref:Uncharacterized protein n=1 Tax=gut metagenome TaxID=749906 RepID=J9GJD8_9ZZZZ
MKYDSIIDDNNETEVNYKFTKLPAGSLGCCTTEATVYSSNE